MGRPRKLWKRAGSSYYYTKIDGVQTRLEKTEAASQRKLERILKGEQTAGPASLGISFAALADQFLEDSQATNEQETYYVHQLFLQSFSDFVGKKRPVARLCEADLDRWCRQHAQGGGRVKAGGRKGGERDAAPWSENTQARARAIVLACLNYGTRKLNLPPHPLAHVRPGTVGSRERYLTAEEREKIRGAVKGCFADYILALEQTGARPFSEVAKVTAADVDLENGTWTLTKWKNARKKKGVKRVIYLTAPVLEMTKQLAQRHLEGPLYRNNNGNPWTRQALTARFRALGERLGIADLTAYCVRHCFISDALARGVPVAVVAELCGTSIQTIQKHYNHLNVKHDVLRDALRQAVGG
jgi:integrase